MKTVYVITNVELGWDCVVCVFNSAYVTMEALLKEFPKEEGYVIHDKDIDTSLSNYY